MITVPLNAKERALWTLQHLVPDSGVLNAAVAIRTRQRLRPALVAATVAAMVRRHSAMRSTFREQDGVVCRVVQDAAGVTVAAGTSDTDRLSRDLTDFAAPPFRLEDEAPYRFAHLRCPTEDVVCLVAHHLAIDGVSGEELLSEFVSGYLTLARGGADPFVDEPTGPEYRAPEPPERSLRFWRAHLDGVPGPARPLACGRADPDVPVFTGSIVRHRLSPAALDAVRRMRQESRSTDNVVLLACYGLLLARHGAGEDFIVGVPVDLREGAARRAVGYHMNTLPLRVRVDGTQTVRDLLRATRRTFVAALDHADVSYEAVVAGSRDGDAAWWVPPFRHMFNFLPPADGAADPAGFEVLDVDTGHSRLDLELVVSRRGGHIELKCAYADAIHDEADVRALLNRFDALIVAAADALDAPAVTVPVAAPGDIAVQAHTNDTARRDPAGLPPVLTSVLSWADRTPDAVAVVDGDGVTTYGELARGARGAASSLRAAGIGPGDVVAVPAERGAPLVSAVLATWMVGAAYLPIDPALPSHRLDYLLADSGAARLLLDEPDRRTEGVATDSGDGQSPGRDERAYVIYTSGSTGQPKGVELSHGNLANVVAHFIEELGTGPEDSTLWLTTFGFDISALEVFVPLVAGGRVVVAPDSARTRAADLLTLVRRHDVSIVQATPTTWRLVADAAGDALIGRRVLCGGEPMSPELAASLRATGCRLTNVYGPTETTIWSTSAEIVDEVTVGLPIANTGVHIIDGYGQPLPPGLVGEVCLSGAGVAIGYLGRPELTAERFGVHPVWGRFYRTGDQGRLRHDGRLELLGRADRQVKLRGHRIELGEVEAVLEEHRAVRQAAVVVVGDSTSDGRLAAVVTRASAVAGDVADDVWTHARDRLPPYSLPSEIVTLDEPLPVNGSNKVDYAAIRLLIDTAAANRPAAEPVEGDDHLLRRIVQLWRDVLGQPDLHHQSNFFREGGHSLLGADLTQQVRDWTGAEVPLSALFTAPTPAAFTRYLVEHGLVRAEAVRSA